MSGKGVFFNRFSQTWTDKEPNEELLSSELIIRGPVVVDRTEYKDYVMLVDNGEGVAVVEFGEDRATVSLFQGERRDSLRASLEIATRLKSLRDSSSSDAAVIRDVAPIILLSKINDLLNPDLIEISLETNKAQLRGVFHAPFAELSYVAERVAAPRAKRISRRAVQVLAAHSEDWLKASGSGVTPRRVEALERDEVVDIYENRVAARLIDDVRRHLKRLLEEDNNLQTLLQDIKGSFRKTERLAYLWARQTPSEELREAQLKRRYRINGLLGLVEEFRDSRLYAGVPQRARVRQPIIRTNLLGQDLNYRGVRRLWEDWWKSRTIEGSPEEYRARLLDETKAFFDLTWLIVSRSLENLSATESPITIRSGEIEFRSNWGSIRLKTKNSFDDGSWELIATNKNSEQPSSSTLVVSIACQILQGTNGDVRSRVNRILRQLDTEKFQNLLICFPGTIREVDLYKDVRELCSLLNPISSFGSNLSRNVWLVPISPLDLESSERVERIVRWIIISQSLDFYPVKVSTSKAVCDFVAGMSLSSIVKNGSDLEINQVLSRKEQVQFENEIDQRVKALQSQLRGIGVAEAGALKTLKSDVRLACTQIDAWMVCPICRNDGLLEARSSHTFESKCKVCESRWGLRHDASSNHRVPFLWMGDGKADIPRGPEISKWLGRDVLAEPCHHLDSEYGSELINPKTGICTGLGSFSTECNRCLNGASISRSLDSIERN